MTESISSYVVDAHHHLWDLSAVEYPWLMQRGSRRFFGDPSAIQTDYKVADFRHDQADMDVRKSVHVQVGAAPGFELKETLWLEEQAERNGLPTAIVAYCDLFEKDAPKTIEAHMKASGRLRGIRQIVSRHAAEDAREDVRRFFTDPGVKANLRHLADLGLSFDLQLTPPYMKLAADLFEQLDGLNVVLCHAGSPWRRDAEGLAEWHSGLQAMAANPRICCKISGLGMFDPEWTDESLRPVISNVIETFGSKRVMWGSNFPVDKLYRRYDELFTAVRSLTPSDEQDQVFRATAERFYRI